MGEEEKKLEEQKTDLEESTKSAIFKTALKIAIGIILIVLGVGLIWYWRQDVLALIRACIGPFAILVGLILIAIARE